MTLSHRQISLLALAIALITGQAATGQSVAGQSFYFNRYGHPIYLEEVSPPTFKNLRFVRYLGGLPLLVTGTVGVQFQGDVPSQEQEKALEQSGLTIARIYAHDPAFLIARVGEDIDPFEAARKLFQSGLVEWAEPTLAEPIRPHAVTPDDPVYAQGVQLHLREDLHGFPSAWEITTGADPVRVAVIDTGIDLAHPELQSNVTTGFDIFSPTGDGSPIEDFEDNHHGTAVAGLIAAATSNGEGIAGVCWECQLLGIRLIDSASTIYVDRSLIYDALRLAIDQGAWIINNSWGPVGRDENKDCVSTPFSEYVAKGVEEAEQDGRAGWGTLVVWSAGNDSCPTDLQPHLANERTVVVSSLDGFGEFQSAYSNYGPHISVSAVEGNFTTDITGSRGASDGTDPYLQKFDGLDAADYIRNFRGTSASAPVVTGALALTLSANPGLTAEETRNCLTQTATKVESPCPHGTWSDTGHSPCYGFGRLDAASLVRHARSGACGGACTTDEDCPKNTTCDKDLDICVFPTPSSTGDGGDTDSQQQPDTETVTDAPLDDSGTETISGGGANCSCRTIGA